MAKRLDDADVAELRRRFAAGERQVDLAAAFGVNQNTVSSLVTGRSRLAAGGPITRSARRKLTPDDAVAIRVAKANGAEQSALAAQYGVSQQMVSNVVHGRAFADAGGPVDQPRSRATPLTPEQVEDIRRQLKSGATRADLAATFGVSVWTIDSVRRGRTTGVRQGDGDVSAEQVRSMRDLYDQGVTQADLASRFGLSQQHVSLIVRGRTHQHEAGPVASARVRTLTVGEVEGIRRDFAAGADILELAERHGAQPQIIRQVVTGATYAAVAGATFAINRRGEIIGPSAGRQGHPA